MKERVLYIVLHFLFLSVAVAQEAKVEKPNLVGIYVRNVEKSAQWYTEMLGFRTFKKMDFPVYDSLKIYFLEKDDFKLELIQKRASRSIAEIDRNYDDEKAPVLGFAKLSFGVKNIKDLESALKKKNVKIKYPLFKDDEFKEMSFIAEDPDGNYIQFKEPF